MPARGVMEQRVPRNPRRAPPGNLEQLGERSVPRAGDLRGARTGLELPLTLEQAPLGARRSSARATNDRRATRSAPVTRMATATATSARSSGLALRDRARSGTPW